MFIQVNTEGGGGANPILSDFYFNNLIIKLLLSLLINFVPFFLIFYYGIEVIRTPKDFNPNN